MVLHSQLAPGGCLVEDAAEVDNLRREGDCADRKYAKQTEFDGKHLVCAGDFDWNTHGELLVLVLGWLLVLLDEETTTRLQNATVRLQLCPNFE